MSYAKSNFLGRLTADPTTKTIGDASLVTFSLACNFPEKGGEKSVHYFDFEAWRAAGDYIAKFARKGDAVFLEADIRNSTYENKDGKKATKTKYVVKPYTFGFCPAGTPKDGPAGEASVASVKAKSSDKVSDPDLSEDVPY